MASSVYWKNVVRLLVRKPSFVVPKLVHSPRLHRSPSTRLVKSSPPATRLASHEVGRQFSVELPMKRLTSWFTTSANISSGVNSR